MNRTLPRSYTAEELDHGEGMSFHPDNAEPFVELEFIQSKHRYCFAPGIYNWMAHDRWLLARIGDGQNHQVGDPYPAHWQFDPFTGERLPS